MSPSERGINGLEQRKEAFMAKIKDLAIPSHTPARSRRDFYPNPCDGGIPKGVYVKEISKGESVLLIAQAYCPVDHINDRPWYLKETEGNWSHAPYPRK